MSQPRCKAEVMWGNFGRVRPCRKSAVMDGWCSVHHPQLIADRRKVKQDSLNARWEREMKQRERQAAIPRKAMELAELAMNYWPPNDARWPEANKLARELLALLDGGGR